MECTRTGLDLTQWRATSASAQTTDGSSPQPRFPLLIKLIEAAQDLSVQVHPDDEYGRRVESDFGKTEAWYVLDCPEDGKVIYGHRFSSREEYLQAVEKKQVKEYLDYAPIAPGRLVFVVMA